MKYLLLSIFTFFVQFLSAQNFSGQWKGQFTDKSTSYMGWGGQTCEYVLELECKGTAVTGFSYTYFTEGGVRYYTICKLSGKLNKREKYVEVTETERVKTNVPTTVRNCFQVHKLFYSKGNEGSETMEGNWNPAPQQSAGCGFGITLLNRRLLKASYPGFNKDGEDLKNKKVVVPVAAKKQITAKPQLSLKKAADPIAAPRTVIPTPKKESETQKEKLNPAGSVTDKKLTVEKPVLEKLAARNNALLNTLYVVSNTIKVELYDNGEIDGDSVSLYFDNQLLAGKQRLTDKPLQFTLDITDTAKVHEVLMYAENLGTIPPNTALMVVTDGVNRYEVRITSDLKKSGTIRFIRKEK